MTPYGKVHSHYDPVCNLTWPCYNELCVDPRERWCGRPQVCVGESELHQVTRLTDVGHHLHLAEQDYRHVFHNEVMARKCGKLRSLILELVEEANATYVFKRRAGG